MKINSNTVSINKESSEYKDLEAILIKIASDHNITDVKEVSIVVDHSISVLGFKTADTVGMSSPDGEGDLTKEHEGIASTATCEDGISAPEKHVEKSARSKAELMRQIHAGEMPVTDAPSSAEDNNSLQKSAAPETAADDSLDKVKNDGSLTSGESSRSASGNTLSAHGMAKSDSEFKKEKGEGQSQLGIDTHIEKKSATKDSYTPKVKDFEFKDGGTDLVPDYIKNRTKVIFTPTTRMAFEKINSNTYRDKYASKYWTLKEKMGGDGQKEMYLVAVETDDIIKE